MPHVRPFLLDRLFTFMIMSLSFQTVAASGAILAPTPCRHRRRTHSRRCRRQVLDQTDARGTVFFHASGGRRGSIFGDDAYTGVGAKIAPTRPSGKTAT